MSRFIKIYKENINGIIITLSLHIIVFTSLFFKELSINTPHTESEILIDFSQIIPEPELPEERIDKTSQPPLAGQLQTNIASNRSSRTAQTQSNKASDNQYEQEIAEAQNLLKDVSRQLKKEIPTIDDLKMPDAPEVKPEDIKDNLYTGESNIEYFLENRHHVKLPIPVYLSEHGGKVKVDILVDPSGKVIKAEPVIQNSHNEQILSYAKTAAMRTIFNRSESAPAQQKGYIIYTFVAQR